MTANIRSAGFAGVLGAALLCLTGGAWAQGYDPYDPYAYGPNETVIIHPDFGVITHERLRGSGRGSLLTPEERVSLSEPVNVSDLDLRYGGDRAELRRRVRQTATRICNRLEFERQAGSVMETTQMDCVADATRNAMRQVDYRY